MEKKTILWIIGMLMLLPICYAGVNTYSPNERIDLGIHLSNLTGDVSGASCNIQLRKPIQTTILNAQMGDIGGGFYDYNYSTSTQGYYYCTQNCTLGASYTSGTCDFIISEDENMILLFYFVLALATLLVALGFYKQEALFVSVGGALIGLMGGYIMVNGFGTTPNQVSVWMGAILVIIGAFLFFRPYFDDMIMFFNSL